MKPFNGRGILLDIEGTTSSISFVHDVMFPFVRDHLREYFDQHWDASELDAFRNQLARDDGGEDWPQWLAAQTQSDAGLTDHAGRPGRQAAEAQVLKLMSCDSKSTGLKLLQGLIWKSGFDSRELEAHVYADVLPAIRAWRERGWDVRIYSSGSIAAQRLFFGHVDGHGDCLDLFSGHYDTTIGNKRESTSYQQLAQDWGLAPGEILFISDLEPELAAAHAAGMQVAASIRPGNTPIPESSPWPRISSFAEVA